LKVKQKENLKLPLFQWWEKPMQSNSFPVTQSFRSQKEKDIKTNITDVQHGSFNPTELNSFAIIPHQQEVRLF